MQQIPPKSSYQTSQTHSGGFISIYFGELSVVNITFVGVGKTEVNGKAVPVLN
jgi:hypothetical protein